MNQQQQPEPSYADRCRTAANLFAFASRTFAATIEVFLHRRIGARALGFPGLAAVFLIFFYGAFWPDQDPRPMTWFLAAYLVMCAISRVGAIRRAAAGAVEHTRYTGESRLTRFFPRMKETTLKGVAEPMAVFVIACLLTPLSPPLGSFLMLAALGLMFSVALSVSYERARMVELQDSFLEQRQLMEEFRARRR